MSHVLTLRGCTPEPLGNYLKALGVFRLLAEQADPDVHAWWEDRVFRIASKWSDQDVIQFFLTGVGQAKLPAYSPTPIFAPWGGRPGFYKDGNREAKSRLTRILIGARRDARLRAAATTIQTIRRELRKRGWLKTKPKKDKLAVMTASRNFWPAPAVDWFDACLAIEEEPRFGFLYGTGGNEGSADITNNFWELVEEVIGLPTPQGHAEETLMSALFDTARASGTSRTAGQHFPSASESPNIGQEFVGATSANPWDVILMMEGCVLFSGATTKRLSQYGKRKAAFPFMVDHVATGEPQVSLKDEPKQDAKTIRCRAEFWLPLWRQPTTLAEIAALLTEGRLQRTGGDPAGHSIDAMEAIASLGISKGIEAFHRVGLFERRGKGYYVAAALGDFPTPRQVHPMSELLGELSSVRDQAYRNLREGPGVPDRVLVSRRRMSLAFAAVLGRHSEHELDPEDAVRVLCSISQLEREVSSLKDHARRLAPCPPLSPKWLELAPNASEYRLARAISAIVPWGERERQGRTTLAIEALRANLSPVARRGNSWQWDETSRSAVWARGADLFDNLASVLRRRLIDATKGTGDGLPLWSGHSAAFSDLLALWNDGVDQERVADLIHALALVDTETWKAESIASQQQARDPTPDLYSGAVWFDPDDEPHVRPEPVTWRDRLLMISQDLRDAFALPRVYSLLKLCFVGGALPARPIEGRPAGRSGEEPFPPAAPEILNLLQAGRLADAVEVAARRLGAKGYPTIIETRGRGAAELDMAPEDCRRLAGMLLIPVRHAGVLAALAIKPRSAGR